MGLFSKNNKAKANPENKGLRITIEHNGSPLYELNTNDYNREIVIGRSPDCTWHLDAVDRSASSKHAMISRRKNHFYLTDLGSRNGIYFQNRRIQERKLEKGDKISLGECTVTVEEPQDSAMKVSRFHRVVYTNEKGKKTIIEVNRPKMLIGSSPDCDIVLLDTLISSKHAELQLKTDGSCWIRPGGSSRHCIPSGNKFSQAMQRASSPLESSGGQDWGG